MADNQQPAGEITIIPEGRRVTKAIGCRDCVHFERGEEVFVRYWHDGETQTFVRQKLVQIRLQGIRPRGFDDGADGLILANLMGKGMSEVQARLELEKRKVAQATEAVRIAAKEEGLPIEGPEWADASLNTFLNFIRQVKQAAIGHCLGGGKKSDGTPHQKTDFVLAGYHCDKWTGRDGWRELLDGRPIDMLPQEMVIRADEKAVPGKVESNTEK